MLDRFLVGQREDLPALGGWKLRVYRKPPRSRTPHNV